MFKKLIASLSIIIRKVIGKYPTDNLYVTVHFVKNHNDLVEEEDIFDDGTNPFE